MSNYHGFPIQTIQTAHLSVDVLSEAGPRIVGLRLAGRAENLLAEAHDVFWDTPNGVFHVYGGHRLWQAPELPAKTYVPDDTGLIIHVLEHGVELNGAFQPQTGIRKQLTVQLDPQHPALELVHRITNEGDAPLVLAPWAITQLPHGGRMFLPQTVGTLPPDEPDAIFWPNRHLVLWNYTRINDPRLHLADDCITIDAEPELPPIKIGYLNTVGWAAYLRGDVLLVKRFEPSLGQPHPDRDVNVTVYCNHQFSELETVAPLAHLLPGEFVEHVERWHLVSGVALNAEYSQIAKIVEGLG